MSEELLCDDCPPVGYPTDKTRCLPCPRRTAIVARADAFEEAAQIADQHSQVRAAAARAAKSLKRRSEARDHESMAIEAAHVARAIRAKASPVLSSGGMDHG